MTNAQIAVNANVVIIGGARNPAAWEKIKTYLLSYLPNTSHNAADWHQHFTFEQTDYSIVGAAMLIGNSLAYGFAPSDWITPYNLEQIGNIVTTYPNDRSLASDRPEQLRCPTVYETCATAIGS